MQQFTVSGGRVVWCSFIAFAAAGLISCLNNDELDDPKDLPLLWEQIHQPALEKHGL